MKFESDKATGLLLPKGTVERERAKAQETWIKEDAKMMNRLQNFFTMKQISVMLVCNQCQKPIGFRNADPGEIGLVAECQCKVRTFKDV